MPTIPPWLAGVNPVDYYVRGLQFGAQIAQQRNAMDADAQRLALSQSAHQFQQQMELRRLQESAQRANLNFELQKQRIGAARQHFDQMDAANRARLALASRLAMAKQQQTAAAAVKPNIENIPGTDLIIAHNPKTGHFQITRKRSGENQTLTSAQMMSMVDKDLGMTDQQRQRIKDILVSRIPGGAQPQAGTQPPPGNTQFTSAGGGPEGPIPEDIGYKEGTRIRNKKTGKYYVVKNGVPVPE